MVNQACPGKLTLYRNGPISSQAQKASVRSNIKLTMIHRVSLYSQSPLVAILVLQPTRLDLDVIFPIYKRLRSIRPTIVLIVGVRC
jgi:hypothetical protein